MKDLSYSNKLYDLRKMNKLSQNKLADELGISRRTISMIENGEQNVSLDYAYRISAYFNLLVQEVFPVTMEKSEQKKNNIDTSGPLCERAFFIAHLHNSDM